MIIGYPWVNFSSRVWVYLIHTLPMAIPSFEHFGIVRLTKYNSSLVYLFNYNYFSLAFLSFLKKKKKFGILSIRFPILDRVIVALEDQTCLCNLKISMDKLKSIFSNLAIIKFFYGILVEITHAHTHTKEWYANLDT